MGHYQQSTPLTPAEQSALREVLRQIREAGGTQEAADRLLAGVSRNVAAAARARLAAVLEGRR